MSASVQRHEATVTDAASSFPPAAEFAEQANATAALYERAEGDRLGFWAEQAERLSWGAPFTDVLDWSEAPFAKWFVGGKLNVAYNCVDRHVAVIEGEIPPQNLGTFSATTTSCLRVEFKFELHLNSALRI